MIQIIPPISFVPEVDQGTPEITLWGAVIRQAIKDLGDIRERKAAIYWFISDRDDVCSFNWCCSYVGLNPEAVRKALSEKLGIRPARLALV